MKSIIVAALLFLVASAGMAACGNDAEEQEDTGNPPYERDDE